MVQRRNNQLRKLFFYPILGYFVYRTFFNLSPDEKIDDITDDLCPNGGKSTLTPTKINAIANEIERISETFINQIWNSSYNECLYQLKFLQNDCDVYALSLAYGQRNTGWTRSFDLNGVVNYIFGSGDDIGIVNNWLAKNRPNITYRF